LTLERDKALHFAAGLGVMLAALILALVNPWFWAVAGGALLLSIIWEYLTRGGIYKDGAKDIVATFLGMGLAGIVVYLIWTGVPP